MGGTPSSSSLLLLLGLCLSVVISRIRRKYTR
jgi:hypothetical protein